MNVIRLFQDQVGNFHLWSLLALGLAYVWLLASYGVMFWYTRHPYALKKMAGWTIFCLFVGYFLYDFTNLDRIYVRVAVVFFALRPFIVVYKYWGGRVRAPGYAHSRDLLLLRRPAASFEQELIKANLERPAYIDSDTD